MRWKFSAPHMIYATDGRSCGEATLWCCISCPNCPLLGLDRGAVLCTTSASASGEGSGTLEKAPASHLWRLLLNGRKQILTEQMCPGICTLRHMWSIVVWHGMAWYSVAWHGMVRHGMAWVWYGMVRYGTVRYGTVRYGTVRYGTVRYGTVRYGTVWYGMVWYGMVWYGMVE